MGMRGAMVPGFGYLSLYPALFLARFGPEWFEQGSLSLFFTYALRHGEELRAVMNDPGDDASDFQVAVRLETPEGHKVGVGTASIGNPAESSYLQSLEMGSAGTDELRILHDIKVGEATQPQDVMMTQETVEQLGHYIYDPLDWYEKGSPWGASILPPSLYYFAMSKGDPNHRITIEEKRAAAFMGAEEVRNVNGPVMLDVPYVCGGQFVGLGSSPKTEFYWYDMWLNEKEDR